MTTPTVYIGLSNPKSPSNVASVLRAAGNFHVEAVHYTGERYPRALKLNPDLPRLGRKVGEDICIRQVDDLVNSVPAKTQVICVELAENATPLPVFQHPQQALYIFGPEDGTLSQALIDKADAVVYIPTAGCMNLAATVNVVLYDRLAKAGQVVDHNDIIRRNRDTNNTVKVR